MSARCSSVMSMTAPLAKDKLEKLEAALGHYLMSAAQKIMGDGIPLASHLTYVTSDEEDGNEGEGTLTFPPDYPIRYYDPHAIGLSVSWSSVSGWFMAGELQGPESGYMFEERWMGAGVVPAPERVAGFVAAALVDFSGTGTEERPYYRNFGQDIENLLDRLQSYQPDGQEFAPSSFEEIFALLRRKATYHLALQDAQSEGQIRLLPVKEGELNALCRLLDWIDAKNDRKLRELSNALATDLRGRFTAGSEQPAERLHELVSRFQDTWRHVQQSQQPPN